MFDDTQMIIAGFDDFQTPLFDTISLPGDAEKTL
jgi:hypothetical protein